MEIPERTVSTILITEIYNVLWTYHRFSLSRVDQSRLEP